MSNEIATYSMILSKLSLGKSGTECPTKTQILAINSLIVIDNASTYGANECVKIDDIRKKVETWNYYLTVSPTSMSFGAGGGSKTFTVSSYKRKVLDGVEQSGDTSVSLKSTTISGTGFSLSGTTVSASANESTSSRSGTVTITQNESNKTATISLSQSGDTASSYGEWVITVSANPTSVSSSGGTSTITASAKRTIYWESGDVTEETGNPTLSTNLGSLSSTASPSTLTLGENTSTSSRTATITASYSGKSATCTVTQDAKPAEDEYYLGVRKSGETSSYESITFNNVPAKTTNWSGDYTYVSRKNGVFFDNVSFSANVSWITVNSSGSYTVAHNTSGSPRQGTITLTQGESGLKCYVNIYQKEYSPTHGMRVSTSSIKVSSSAQNVNFSVDSYKTVLHSDGSETEESVDYTFSTDSKWFTYYGNTTNTTGIVITSNITTSQRSATFTLTQVGGKSKGIVTVTQAAGQGGGVTDTFTVTPSSQTVSGNSATAVVNSSSPWTARIGQGTNYSTVSPTSGSAGQTTITISDTTSSYQEVQATITRTFPSYKEITATVIFAR